MTHPAQAAATGAQAPASTATRARKQGSDHPRSYWIPAGHSPDILPLRVTEIGESWWPRGESCQRICSAIMAIELVGRGSIQLEQDGRMAEIGGGQAFILKRGAQHAYSATAGIVRKSYIGLSGALAEEVLAQLPDQVLLRDAHAVMRIFRRLRTIMSRPRADGHVQASCLLYQLLIELLMSSREERGEAILHPAIVRVLPVLEGRNGRTHSIAHLARIAGVSPAHLNRLFRASLKTTPQQYGLRFCMRRAQEQLLNSRRSCREIALDLGFTPLYFSAAFRRLVGVSPKTFRNEHR